MRVSSQPLFVFFLEQSDVYSRLTNSLNWAINLSVCGVRNQHPVVWTLPCCLMTFIWNFILTWKYQKWYLDTGTLVYNQLRFANLSALLQFYNKCPFLCPFRFFCTGHCPIILDYSLQLYTPTFADYILLSHHHLIYNHINFCLSHDSSVEHAMYIWLVVLFRFSI